MAYVYQCKYIYIYLFAYFTSATNLLASHIGYSNLHQIHCQGSETCNVTQITGHSSDLWHIKFRQICLTLIRSSTWVWMEESYGSPSEVKRRKRFTRRCWRMWKPISKTLDSTTLGVELVGEGGKEWSLQDLICIYIYLSLSLSPSPSRRSS